MWILVVRLLFALTATVRPYRGISAVELFQVVPFGWFYASELVVALEPVQTKVKRSSAFRLRFALTRRIRFRVKVHALFMKKAGWFGDWEGSA